MATDVTNGDTQVAIEEKEETTSEVLEVPADESSVYEDSTEVIEPTEVENSVSEISEPQSETVIEDGQNESSEVADTKAVENTEDSKAAEVGIDSTQPSTSTPDDSKQDDEQKKNLERRRRSRRGGKGVLVRKLASLNLPNGIILVQDKRYTGYHCTFCNCVLKALPTVKAHINGKWHRRTLQMKRVNESPKSAAIPTPKASPKVPLKSSLEEYLSVTTTAIVGLSYVIETQRPNKKPTFQCNLCEVSCDSDDIKEHINGMKHCLMYLKLVKPTKLAELLAKQLSKPEKNKEIAKLSEELEQENGRGEITVKSLQVKEATAPTPPGRRPPNRFQRGGNMFRNRQQRWGRGGNQYFNRPQAVGNRSGAVGNRSAKPITRAVPFANQRNRNFQGARRGNIQNVQKPPAQQKRRNEGVGPAKKRQFVERDFLAHAQFGMESAPSNFYPGGWGMRNEPMDVAPYQNESNFYPNYPNFYPDSYGERRPLNRQQYMSEPYERMGQFPEREFYRRERYDDRQPYWSDRRDHFASNKPRNYNRSNSPMHKADHSKDSNQLSALKRLAGFNVSSEEDAGVVINAINSLTNSFMNYKLRDLSGPVQQLLQKSLKGNDLTSLINLPEKSTGNTRSRYGGRSQTDRDWGVSQIAKPQNWMF